MNELKWLPVVFLPKRSEKFVLAKTADGRVMVFRASILVGMMRSDTPNHLQFPATHFIMCDSLLSIPEA